MSNTDQSEDEKKKSDIVLRADAYEKINEKHHSKLTYEMLKNILLASLKHATEDIEHSKQFLAMYNACNDSPEKEIILQLESSHFPFSAGTDKSDVEMLDNLPTLLSNMCHRLEKLVQEKGVRLVELKFENVPPHEKDDCHALCSRSRLLSRQLCSIGILLSKPQPINDSKMKILDENFVKAKLDSYAEQIVEQNTKALFESERVNLLREAIAIWNGIPSSQNASLQRAIKTEELNFAKGTVMRLEHLTQAVYDMLKQCEKKYHEILLANEYQPPEEFITRSALVNDTKRFLDHLWANLFHYEKVIDEQNQQIKERKVHFHVCETKVRALQMTKETFERQIKMQTQLPNSLLLQCKSDDETVEHCSFMQAIQEYLNNESNRSTANVQIDVNELLNEAECATQADIEMITEEIKKLKENCQKEKSEHENESAELQSKYSKLLEELENVKSSITTKRLAYISKSSKVNLISQFITMKQWKQQHIIGSLYWSRLIERIKLENHNLSDQLQASWKHNLELIKLKSSLENENLQYTACLEKLENELQALIPQIASKEFYEKCLQSDEQVNKEKDSEEIYLKQNEIICEEIKHLNEMSHYLHKKKAHLERYTKKKDEDGKELTKKIAELENLENRMKICIGELESHLHD
ncbi:hypothetical protein T4B_2350 [Trichinella pseudospiralis]|uniref:Uncharacterized protein n=1 Tax=Trichinella pseudospiralis TaxID=6337 RepID=A0A0V1F2D1_TRIPS|nr:hypothetical protein T4A_6012 [Trichinella pseudospiralis]KRZ30510.1 hypothetical protein T4B_2350 [Trichinella pseudospiralis]KRZ42717.1 hypothetical protein T4C_6648 [Trichinella pseudospiralis]